MGQLTLRLFFVIAVLSVFAEVSEAQICVSSDHNDNTACGTDALPGTSTMPGNNSAFGFDALYSNTSGSYNTASGEGALYSNTMGSYNSAFGQVALSGR